jgi:hypothetical protein
LNFKLLSILFLVVSCGLKTTPKRPQGTDLPSLTEEYSKDFVLKSVKKKKKKQN